MMEKYGYTPEEQEPEKGAKPTLHEKHKNLQKPQEPQEPTKEPAKNVHDKHK